MTHLDTLGQIAISEVLNNCLTTFAISAWEVSRPWKREDLILFNFGDFGIWVKVIPRTASAVKKMKCIE